MHLVSNGPHPLRPSAHVSPSGYHCPACFPTAQAEAMVFGDIHIYPWLPYLGAHPPTVPWSALCFCLLHCAESLGNEGQAPGMKSIQWLSVVIDSPWSSQKSLWKKTETCHSPKDENNRTTDSTTRWRTWLQRRGACTPHLPVLSRTPDLRMVFPREIVCPWKQSQTNRVRETRVKYPHNYL